MPIKVLMPALSPTMTEGTLTAWHKKEGDPVAIGEVIAEIETDKATMEVEAVEEGTLGRILVPEGTEGVAVNAPIALLLEEGEDPSALDDGVAAEPEQPAAEMEEKAEQEPAERPQEARPSDGAGAPDQSEERSGRVFASPLARRLAAQAGLDLASIKGSGPRGRIVKADVEAAEKRKAEPAAEPASARPAAAPAPAAGIDARAIADAAGIPYTEVKNTGMRKTIARRLLESKLEIPHFYVTVECEIDALLDLRRTLNAGGEKSGVRLSVNDLVIKAAALALRRVPEANAAWTEEATLRFDRVDVSVAVDTDGGLITPIVKDADRKGLAQISEEMKDLASRAREGKLKPEEFQGGTFSISNLGMFGVDEFSAIINPPQGCILAVGAGAPKPVVKEGAVAVATCMKVTLSCDHRVVDGVVGARYLQAFKELVENPLSMML